MRVLSLSQDLRLPETLMNEMYQWASIPLVGESMPLEEVAPNSVAVLNPVVGQRLLDWGLPYVEKEVGRPLVAMGSYARDYCRGGALHYLVDRGDLDWTLAIPAYQSDGNWALRVGSELIDAELGQAILYAGSTVEHGRESYPGRRYVELLLHYGVKREETGDSKVYVRGLLTSEECRKLVSSVSDARDWVGCDGGGSKVLRRWKPEYKWLHDRLECEVQSVAGELGLPGFTFSPEMQVSRYQEGEGFIWHVDENETIVAGIVTLQEARSGGEFEVEGLYADYGVGVVLIFAGHKVRHRVAPVRSGTRYSLVTWFRERFDD